MCNLYRVILLVTELSNTEGSDPIGVRFFDLKQVSMHR